MGFPNRETQFRPGQSGNPAGRPLGRTVSARLRELLDQAGVIDAVSAVILKGIKDGDIRYVHLFIDRTEGKTPPAPPESRGPAAESILFYLPDNGRTRPAAAGPEDHPA